MLIRMLTLAAFAPLMLLAACGGDDNATTTAKATQTAAASGGSSQPQDITITAANFSLSPTTITAAAGQVINITFKNTGAAEHSFTIGTRDVADVDPGATKTGSFTASATTVEFHCKYHSTTMKGTITVSGSSSSNGLNTVPASASAAPAGYIGY
jgi:plastocyanin